MSDIPVIPEKHKETFDALIAGMIEPVALVACEYEGEPTSAVVLVTETEEDFQFHPIMVFLTDKILDKLTLDGQVAKTEEGWREAEGVGKQS